MNRTTVYLMSSVVGAFSLSILACESGSTPDPLAPQAQVTAVTAPEMLSCPVTDWQIAWGMIVPHKGGTVAVESGSITLPPGAVDQPTFIMVLAPEGPHAILDVRANGKEHFEFQKPVEISFDYSRCADAASGGSLEAWEVDSETHALIEPVGGSNYPDKAEYRIRPDHLTSYTILGN